jgi:N-acetyl-anhydromuramyl-L-alanine amidase AmpD
MLMNLKNYLFGDDSIKQAENLKVVEANNLKKLNLNEIISVTLPDNQYFKESTLKKQIVLHHTVSGQGVDGDISWWRSTSDRIGTVIIVGWDGKIYQCFSSQYWAHHLGVHAANNKALNMASIGIEIDSWGGLVRSNGMWYPAIWDKNLGRYVANTSIKPIQNVQEYEKGFKGFYGYEKYTDAQIEAVRKLLVYFGEKYNISLAYNESMWDVSNEALSGKSGVWTHVSFRNGKSDCYPDERLIEMLKNLNK